MNAQNCFTKSRRRALVAISASSFFSALSSGARAAEIAPRSFYDIRPTSLAGLDLHIANAPVFVHLPAAPAVNITTRAAMIPAFSRYCRCRST